MNTNLGNKYIIKQKLNQTHPSDPPLKKPQQTMLQKHHSFCYFQPIHSVEDNTNSYFSADTNEPIGPLIYKPNTTKTNAFADHNNRTWVDKRKPYQQIDPKHKESFDKLHDLLKRNPGTDKSKSVPKKQALLNTYTLNSLNRHKYVPKAEDNNNTIVQKRLVYADLDLEDHNKKYNEKVNCNRRLFSKDKSSSDELKCKTDKTIDNLAELKKKHRTEYATLKFEEVQL